MRKYSCLMAVVVICLLVGCGNKKEEDSFEEGLKNFYDNVNVTSLSMNEIDTLQPDYNLQMLSYLDDMNQYFTSLKQLDIPEEYSDISANITNAYSYMNQANILYHQALENGNSDYDTLIIAKNYYDNAIECINNVGISLSED